MNDPAMPLDEQQIDVAEPVNFGLRRIGHMNLFVGDLDRSMRFYNHVCGLEEVGRSDRIGAGFLSNGNTHHDVGVLVATGKGLIAKDGHVSVPKTRGHRPGLNHIGWEMPSEWHLVSAYKRAVAAGLKIHRTVDHAISRSVYVFDPDGHLHEIYADTTLAWREILGAESLDGLTTGWTPGIDEPSAEPKYDLAPDFRRVGDAAFHARHLSHCTLSVRRFDRMRAFYVDVMGLEPVLEASDPAMVVLRGQSGSIDLTLVERRPDEIGGMHHFSFEVADEATLRASAEHYSAHGSGIEHIFDLPHKYGVFITDPDGMRVELFARRAAGLTLSAVPPLLRSYAV